MLKIIKTIIFIIFFNFLFIITPSISQTNKYVPLNNIVAHTSPKLISPILFQDFSGNDVNLRDYIGKLVIVNFWATWCEPCKEEMPSLDGLYQDDNFKNLSIFAVNMENPNSQKAKNFFSDLKIKKLEIFFDPNLNFVKKLKLRGVPTTILINKNGEEFARITGAINFKDRKFLNWLAAYD